VKVADEKEKLECSDCETYRLIHYKSFQNGCAIFSIMHDFKNNKYYFIQRTLETRSNKKGKVIKFHNAFTSDSIIYSFRLRESSKREITNEEWKEFKSLIYGSYFWSLGIKANEKHSRTGMDPDAFSLEGFSRNDYHYVRRSNPHKGTFRDLCMKFYEFSDYEYDWYKPFDELKSN